MVLIKVVALINLSGTYITIIELSLTY